MDYVVSERIQFSAAELCPSNVVVDIEDVLVFRRAAESLNSYLPVSRRIRFPGPHHSKTRALLAVLHADDRPDREHVPQSFQAPTLIGNVHRLRLLNEHVAFRRQVGHKCAYSRRHAFFASHVHRGNSSRLQANRRITEVTVRRLIAVNQSLRRHHGYFRDLPSALKQIVSGLCHTRLKSQAVLISRSILLLLFGCTSVVLAQQPAQQPQVRVNYLNVCTPSAADQQEISSALKLVPAKPRFASDFEVSRGRTSMDESSVAAGIGAQMSDTPSVSRWVRIRRDFPSQSPFLTAQYSFSVGDSRVTETLVFRLRDPKDLLQISISDTVNAPADASQVAGMNTPPDRIRIERFGKGSVVLARCKEADQSQYEPLFQNAAALLSTYRSALNVHKTVVSDLAKVPASSPPKQKAIAGKKK